MRILKNNSILKLVNSYLIDASQPSNISYLWNFGSLLAVCLVFQLITGITLAMHYIPNILEAFNSIEHIMRDVNNGWFVRYLHSNVASAFFALVFCHIARGMFYGSYRLPRTLVWAIGTIILIAMMATAFLGYVLPYGQMSLWGATVITNLISAIPWIGQDVVEFIWGGFSVNNATLNRFFALHYLLPFILAALILMHLISLHDTAGSSNPLGTSGNFDRLTFAPYYLFKDLITIFIFFLVLSMFVYWMPNVLGDSENYIMANPMQTPPAIVPEWYLLPFYAILRSIPNKLLGVIAMFSAILAILILFLTDLGRSKGLQFRPVSKFFIWLFGVNFAILMILGACHVENPFIWLGQGGTIAYFIYFISIGSISLMENSIMVLNNRIRIPIEKSARAPWYTKYIPKIRELIEDLHEAKQAIILYIRLVITLVMWIYCNESQFWALCTGEDPDNDNNNPEPVEGEREENNPEAEEGEGEENNPEAEEGEGEDTQQPLSPRSPDRPGSPDSNDTGYGTHPDREYLDQGADAMLSYPANELPDDQLERYRRDLREMLEESYVDPQTRNEIVERIQELDNESTRRDSRNSRNSNNSNNS